MRAKLAVIWPQFRWVVPRPDSDEPLGSAADLAEDVGPLRSC